MTITRVLSRTDRKVWEKVVQRPQDKSRRPSARYAHAALELNHQSAPSMLVVGGYNQKQAFDDVWQFDLGFSTTSSWLPSAGL